MYVIKNNFKYSLEYKYINNKNIINQILEEIDYCRNDILEQNLYEDLDIYEKQNIQINKLLNSIYIYDII